MSFPADPSFVAPDELRRIKFDRRFLELALRLAGQMLGQDVQISGDASRCPFHIDEHPSGSLHEDWTPGRAKTWLYTCHGCGSESGSWNQNNPQRPSNSGDAVAVLRAASKRAGTELPFAAACRVLQDAFVQRYGPSRPKASPVAPATTGAALAALQRAESEARNAHQRLINDPELCRRLWEQCERRLKIAAPGG